MRHWYKEWMDHYYLRRPGWVGGTDLFKDLITGHCNLDKTLEVGCGPSNNFSRWLKRNSGRLDGLDIDSAAKDNDALDGFILAGTTWQIPDASYSAVVSNYVLEHVKEPETLLKEIRRILMPGGAFAFRTPNIWHPLCIFSYLSPHGLHRKLSGIMRGKAWIDPYPTFYRMNSRRRLKRLFKRTSVNWVEAKTLMVEREPSYAASSRILFLLMMAYERTVNAAEWLSMFRVNIFSVYLNKCERLSGDSKEG